MKFRWFPLLVLVWPLLTMGMTGCSDSEASTPTSPAANSVSSALQITSLPPTNAVVGQLYRYQLAVQTPGGASLSYYLAQGPSGMQLNSVTGLIQWTPQSSQMGTESVTVEVLDGTYRQNSTWMIQVVPASSASSPSTGGSGPSAPPTIGTNPLPTTLTMTSVGQLPHNQAVLSDLTPFDGKLFIAGSINPLSSPFGAGIYTYHPSTGIRTAVYDGGSQGFLRARVAGGKLFVPDADPNGMSNGVVYVWSSSSTSPQKTVVPGGVHQFDVAQLNGNIYVSGAVNGNVQTLHRYNPTQSTWTLASQSSPESYATNRLKYLGVADGMIYGSTSPNRANNGFVIGPNMVQSGWNPLAHRGLILCMENIESRLYFCGYDSTLGKTRLFYRSGGAETDLTGDIAGKIVWDFVRHSYGNYYAVGTDTNRSLIWASSDGIQWTEVVGVDDLRFGLVSNNADGRASIASFQGKLYVGSSTNGRLYRLD